MSETLTNAAADATEALPLNETPPEPVEVEIPHEEGGPPPPEAAPAEPPKKRGRPPNERIATLVGEKNNLMQELEAERRRSHELATSLQTKEAELTAGQTRQMELHKARLQSDAERARNEYESAFRDQDPRKQADATAKLARSESGLADVEAWEARNKPAQPAQQPQGQPQQQPFQPQQRQPEQQIDPATAAWISENPWFAPGTAEHDPVMHMTAIAYAARIERRLQNEGRANAIASPEYWNEVNQYMAKEFPDRFEVEEQDNAAPANQPRQSSPVAPATRSQPQTLGTRTPANGKTLAQLSGPERAMADALRNSGSLLYPADHPKVQANPALRGSRMSPEDAYITYAIQIRRDKADQAVRRANQ